MTDSSWRYYNHAMVSALTPDKTPNLDLVKSGKIWNGEGLFAVWTTNYDCKAPTDWWYVIKDDPFDISKLNSKKRWKITKGLKNFTVRKIEPFEYAEALADVQIKAFSAYPKKYRPKVDKAKATSYFRSLKGKDDCLFYAAFDKENVLSAYIQFDVHDTCFSMNVEKSDPTKEKERVNAALLAEAFKSLPISKSRYVSNGTRSVVHQTLFDDYLEYLFGFRKAYCKLHIAYRPGFGILVQCLYLFRKMLLKLDWIGLVHKINGVLKMEEIVRRQK